MRVVGFIGSPRRGGNTDVLVSEVLRGAASCGAEIEAMYLNELDIRGCQACEACKGGDKYFGCVLPDDMSAIYEKIIAADALIVGSPVYCFGPTAQAKAFLDRWYAFGFQERGERKSLLEGKKMVLVLLYGDRNPLTSGVFNTYATFRDEASWCRLEITSVLQASASKPGEICANRSVMVEAYEAGKDLVALTQKGKCNGD